MTFNYALSDLVLPPTSLIALTLLGLLLLRRRRVLGIALIGASQLVLLVLSLPVVAIALVRPLEPPPVQPAALKDAQAIVILGGGRNRGAPEWGGETVKAGTTLPRLRYGARLARETGLPVYVTGGKPDGGAHAEGTLMKDVLEREFGVTVRWAEIDSATTAENARFTARDLKAAGITRIALVTDAMHMPRSQRAFEQAGLQVIASPTAYAGQRPFRPWQLVPGIIALHLSNSALREWVSRGLYAARGD